MCRGTIPKQEGPASLKYSRLAPLFYRIHTTFKYRLSEDVQTSTLSYHFFSKTTKGYLRWNLRCIYLGESIDEPVSKDLILGCFRSFGICVILSNDLVMFCFIINYIVTETKYCREIAQNDVKMYHKRPKLQLIKLCEVVS